MKSAREFCDELDNELGEAWSNDYDDLPKYMQQYADMCLQEHPRYNKLDNVISAFSFAMGKKIEELIIDQTNNLQERNRLLEARILQWYMKTKDKEFAAYFEITITR